MTEILLVLLLFLFRSITLGNGHLIPNSSHSTRFKMTELVQAPKAVERLEEKQEIPYMVNSPVVESPKNSEKPKEVLTEYNKLHLKSPDSSIFTPGFQFLFIDTIGEEEEGQILSSSLVLRDATPAESLMKNLEFNVLDPNSDTRARVQNNDQSHKNQEQGKYRIMPGMIDGMAITLEHHHQVVTGLRHQTNLPPPPPPPYETKDYVDLHRNLTIPPAADEDRNDHDGPPFNKIQGMRTEARPEVFVIFDYANTLAFKKNNTAIVDYLSVYFHGVNNRYATVNEPRIVFKISGVMAVYSRKAQPFLEKYRLRDGGGFDINLVLDGFATWIYTKRRQLPKNDVAHLITGEIMKMKDPSTGKYVDSISGLSFLKGACWVSSEMKKSLATSITEDRNGIWDGVFTTAHELAHSLGVSHDGSGDTLKCPWSDGYIMSYSGWGSRNKFFFSECSIKAMKEFISSKEGSCLLKGYENTSASTYHVDNTGERLDMTTLCQKYTNKPFAYVDPEVHPSDLCKNLICRYPDDVNGYHLVRVNHPPGDNATCNNSNGRCYNGDCVNAIQ